MTVLRVKTGDTVIYQCATKPSMEVATHIKRTVQAFIPATVRVLVIGPGDNIGVIRNVPDDEPTRTTEDSS